MQAAFGLLFLSPMEFDLDRSIEILERTPAVMRSLLAGLDAQWTQNNEGEDSWSPYDVIGHLLHGEATDWLPRILIIMNDGDNKTFEPFDRFAQFENSKGKSLEQLLEEFAAFRDRNLSALKALDIQESDLDRPGIHPALGPVNLRQVIATWVAHDLGHIVQVSRVMAKQYKDQVGPWTQYLKVLNS